MSSQLLHYFKSIVLAAFCLLAAGLFGCSSTPTATPFPRQNQLLVAAPQMITSDFRQDIMHEVAPMETLWRISKMYDVPQEAIISANHLRNPAAISVGQKLVIPDAAKHRSVIPLYTTRPWSYIVIHHTASEAGNALTIDRAHHNRGFWDGLGYHFLIDNGTLGKEAGQIEAGPRWIKQRDGAHCNVGGMNENGIGISLVGNFSETQVSRKQLESLVFLVNVLRKHYKIPLDHIVRHQDVPGKNTECPGNYFPWLEFKNELARS